MTNRKAATDANGARVAFREEMPVGQQVRELRKAKGMTLAALAARIRRSVGFVSQVERDFSKPTVGDLSAIAEVLGVQLSWFFQGNAIAPVEERDHIVRQHNRRQLDFVVRGDSQQRLTYLEHGHLEELVSPNLQGTIELLITTFGPHSSSGDELIRRDAEEAGLLLSGRLELWVEARQFCLEAGDSFRVYRSEGLRWSNPYDEEVKIVWVMSPPVF